MCAVPQDPTSTPRGSDAGDSAHGTAAAQMVDLPPGTDAEQLVDLPPGTDAAHLVDLPPGTDAAQSVDLPPVADAGKGVDLPPVADAAGAFGGAADQDFEAFANILSTRGGLRCAAHSRHMHFALQAFSIVAILSMFA